MKAYLDSEDSYYRYNEESVKEELIKSKTKKDYAGIGAIIFTFTVLSIVIALSIYTAYQIAYGQSAFLGGFSLYNNTDYGFKVLYPQNWITIEGDTITGDYYTDIVRFEPSDQQGKHYSKKYPCGEVCFIIWIDNTVKSQGLSLEQYSDDYYNSVKNQKGENLSQKTFLFRYYKLDIKSNPGFLIPFY